MVRADGNHLTRTYSKAIAPEVADLLKANAILPASEMLCRLSYSGGRD